MFEIFFFLTSIIATLAVIGHGIWVLAALVIKSLFGGNSKERALAETRAKIQRLRFYHYIDEETFRQLDRVLHGEVPIPKQQPTGKLGSIPKVNPERLNTATNAADPKHLEPKPAESPPVVKPVEPVTGRPSWGTAELTADEPEVESIPPAETKPVAKPTSKAAQQRVEEYVQRRQAAMADTAEEQAAAISGHPNPTAHPKKPQRSLADVMSGFLQVANIRWGELVGGLLIVSCSTALVISFWAEISANPLLKFGVFNSVIALLFFIGIYAHRHWNLPTTSQGVLTIAMLLVPLNFLAIAAFTKNNELTIGTIVGELMSIAILLGLGFLGAKILTPRWPIATTVAAVALPVWQLLIRRFGISDQAPSMSMGLLGGVAVTYGVAQFPVMLKLRKLLPRSEMLTDEVELDVVDVGVGDNANEESGEVQSLATSATEREREEVQSLATSATERGEDKANDERKEDSKAISIQKLAGQTWILLGLSTFAATISLGFAMSQTEDTTYLLQKLSIFTGILVTPGLAFATLVGNRARKTSHAATMVASSAVGLGALLILAVGTYWAWPIPHLMMLSCLVIVVVATAMAFVNDTKELHFVAAPFLALLTILACKLVAAEITWQSPITVGTLLSASTAWQLSIGFVIASCLGVAYGKTVGGKHRDTLLIIAAILAASSMVLAIGFGFGRLGDPTRLIWLSVGYSLLVAAVTFKRPNRVGSWLVCSLAALACLQAIVFAYPLDVPVVVRFCISILLTCTVTTIGGLLLEKLLADRADLAEPVKLFSLGAACLASVALVFGWSVAFDDLSPWYLGWCTAIWLGVASLLRLRLLLRVFQWALFLTISFAVYRWQLDTGAITDGVKGFLHAVSIQAQTIVCSAAALFWIGFRTAFPPLQNVETNDVRRCAFRDLEANWEFDRSIMVIAILGLLYFVSSSVIPGVGQELALVARGNDAPPLSEFWLEGIGVTSAKSPFAWLALCLTAGVLILSSKESTARQSNKTWRSVLVGSIVGIYLLFVFAAGFWVSQVSVASALRWSTAIFFLLGSVAIWSVNYWKLGIFANAENDKTTWNRIAFTTIIALAATPLLGMVAYVALAAFLISPPAIELLIAMVVAAGLLAASGGTLGLAGDRERIRLTASAASSIFVIMLFAIIVLVVVQAILRYPIVGPIQDSIFRRMGFNASYVVPLLFYTVGFVGFTHFYKSAALALTSSFLVCVCGTTGFLFVFGKSGLSPQLILNLCQLNTILASVSIVAWKLWSQATQQDAAKHAGLISVLQNTAIGFFAIPMVTAAASLFVFPLRVFRIEFVAGVWGWGSLAMLAFSTWIVDKKWTPTLILNGLVAAAVLGACEVHRFDPGTWRSFHVLLTSLMILAPMAAAIDLYFNRNRDRKIIDTSLCMWLIVLTATFAVRSAFGNQNPEFWSTSGLVAASLAAALLWCSTLRGIHFGLTTSLLCITVIVWWFQIGSVVNPALTPFGWLVDVARLLAMAFSLPIVAATLILRWRKCDLERKCQIERLLSKLKTGVVWCLGTVSVLVLIRGMSRGPVGSTLVIGWTAIDLGLGAVLVGMMWQKPKQLGLAIYASGFCLVAMFLESLRTTPQILVWSVCLSLSAYGLVASYFTSRREELEAFAVRYSLNLGESSHGSIQAIQVVLAIVVACLGVFIQFNSPIAAIRLACSQAVLAQVFALALLARGKRESELRLAALTIGVVGAIAFSWSWFAHDAIRTLDRAVSAAAAIGVVTCLYSFGIVKLVKNANDWTRSVQLILPFLVGIMGVILLSVLGIETEAFFSGRELQISAFSITLVFAVLLAAVVACLAFAFFPGHDPLSLEESRRGLYIYGAEIVLALLFQHMRTSMPWLFTGWFQQFWPLIVVGISFVGVGIAELFRRLKRSELAKPLENTGAFLPVLPAIGFWLSPSNVNYTLLMLSTGVLYIALSTMRKSFLFGILAAISLNVGFWHFLSGQSISIAKHPQIWFIPPAACVLVAAWINRHRLTESQFVSIRYLAATVIYVSSTADIFLNGVANAPWLPLVLAGISIAGVFAGIWLRVRSFLFLGISFLFVSLMTIIWHAAVDLNHTWLWYVCGIAAGCLILFVFALFEKKRQTVLETFKRLREWEA